MVNFTYTYYEIKLRYLYCVYFCHYILKCNFSLTNSADDQDDFYLIDKTSLEQWRLAGLPTDNFFTENAIAIQESSK